MNLPKTMSRKKKEINVLKKRIKACELQLKALLDEKGLKYHASAFETESTLINGRETVLTGSGVWHYVKAAIEDVRCNAAEFVDDDFCSSIGLPSPKQSAGYTDVQALYLSMIVPELYPDFDDRLLKDPHLPELLFPALAHHKLKTTKKIVEDNIITLSEVDGLSAELKGILSKIYALLSDVEIIVEMMSLSRRKFSGEKTLSPLLKLKADAENKAAKVSEIRRSVTKKSSIQKEVMEFQGKVRELVSKVVSEMGKYHLPISKETVRRLCLDAFTPQDRKQYVDDRYKHLAAGCGDYKNRNTTLLKQAKRDVNALYDFVYELIDEFLVSYESKDDGEKSEELFNDDRLLKYLRNIIEKEV
ncbi:hypothetical protein P3498_22420 [Vibrio parahaemolyticus]|uniref:hypothetical protein n=4 Tax=Vibrio parahaemolyticus TaxID=670 RepID=UPI001C600A67|nr:hypothetical protein [Vibrio parahaemolyticus]EJM7154540.1 hypothetical protein [Vibrio parahaemolyticus]MDF4618570.1 hypothetical protein [Vibrio parahaemolyticus]HCG5939672.1 hypothetical protein [Vibrio parahaemolyticus]